MEYENTHHYPLDTRLTGIKIGNTRIIENNFKDQERLTVFNGFLEYDRLGLYHGYWSRKQAKELVKYLQDWIKRTENADTKTDTD